MRVLVVKDHAALAGQAAATLEAARFAVDHAADGEDALFLGRTEPYDAVGLDLGLPRLDGLSVLRGWRTGNRTMPVLTARDAWTGKSAKETAAESHRAHKRYCLRKPTLEPVIARTRRFKRFDASCSPVSTRHAANARASASPMPCPPNRTALPG